MVAVTSFPFGAEGSTVGPSMKRPGGACDAPGPAQEV
jgi:hypothetical protein